MLSFVEFLLFDIISLWLVVELTAEYAATRKQFNKSLSEFGMIQVCSTFP